MSNPQINPLWNDFIQAIRKEVKPAVGCTEPVSLALAAATSASYLPEAAEKIDAWVSPNLMKNGMGVTVPGTGMVGLPIAAAIGALAGDAQAGLEVLKTVSDDSLQAAKTLLNEGKVNIMLQQPCDEILYSRATVYSQGESATTTIAGGHTHIIRIEKNGEIIFDSAPEEKTSQQADPLAVLATSTLRQVLDFAQNVPFENIRFILEAASLNDALSQEGLRTEWGLHIGATLQRQYAKGLLSKDLLSDIMIRTSAASDARMGGASLPAMSNSGSGNQGITATMPIVAVADFVKADEEHLARALILSHLTAVYIHNKLPRLSALCATTTAGMGAAAGMAWLLDGDYKVISMAIGSMVGDVSGMICDGASNSCAMKVSTSVVAAWKAVLMALDNTAVTGNEGIVAHDVETSIENLCALARQSMQQVDVQIIDIMSHKAS